MYILITVLACIYLYAIIGAMVSALISRYSFDLLEEEVVVVAALWPIIILVMIPLWVYDKLS